MMREIAEKIGRSQRVGQRKYLSNNWAWKYVKTLHNLLINKKNSLELTHFGQLVSSCH